MSDDTIEIDLNAEISRRKVLGALGAAGVGTAATGAGTWALLSDRESFGTANNPNTIQAGEVDLTVDWEVNYFGAGGPREIAKQETPVDRPGPIVDVTDLKPGDIIEKTLSTHIQTNPGFLTFNMTVLSDEDNGINNPEDAVDGSFDDSDGTDGGDLAENLNCVVWYDGFEDSDGNARGSGGTPGNNRPDEGIWEGGGDPTNDDDFEKGLDSAQSPSDAFDTSSDLVIASGKLSDLASTSNPILIDSGDQGDTPSDFSNSACYDNGAVQYIGCVCWLPRDVPGIEDNLLQSDRLEYKFEFGAVQCRDNVDSNGEPLSTNVASQPGGGNDPPTADFVVSNELTEGTPTQFDAAPSSDSDGTIVQYEWVIDGSVVQSGSSPTLTTGFVQGGDHSVTLTVTDDNGATDSVTKTVESFQDADADLYGDASPPQGVTAGTDCDDTDENTYPGATELGDSKDNDCDGSVDEGI